MVMNKKNNIRLISAMMVIMYVFTFIMADFSYVLAAETSIVNNNGRISDKDSTASGRISDSSASSNQTPSGTNAQTSASGGGTNETLVNKAIDAVTDPKFIGGTVIAGNAAGFAGDYVGAGVSTGVSKALSYSATKITHAATTRVLSRAATIASFAIPGVGPVLGNFVGQVIGNIGTFMGGSVAEDIAAKKTPSFKKALASIDWTMCMAQSIGGTIGAIALTLAFPPLGIVAAIGGSVIGSFLGEMALNGIRKLFSKKKDTDKVPDSASTENSKISKATSGEVQNNSEESGISNNAGLTSDAVTVEKTSVNNDADAKKIYEQMNAHYSNYLKYVENNQGESAAAKAELSEYTKLSDQYSKLKK